MSIQEIEFARRQFIVETEQGIFELWRNHNVSPPVWLPSPPKSKGSPRAPRRLREKVIFSNTLLVSLWVTFVSLAVPAVILLPAP